MIDIADIPPVLKDANGGARARLMPAANRRRARARPNGGEDRERTRSAGAPRRPGERRGSAPRRELAAVGRSMDKTRQYEVNKKKSTCGFTWALDPGREALQASGKLDFRQPQVRHAVSA
eukprot:SAG31_NODE_25063_length_468_cov_1.547425_1_plen_119_part_10